jgi:hypothetical protein
MVRAQRMKQIHSHEEQNCEETMCPGVKNRDENEFAYEP